jgi:hypothetical protein
VVHDAIERLYTALFTNFATDMAAVITEKGAGVVGLVNTATVIKRQTAEIFVQKAQAPPAIGIYGIRATTQAKDQGKRDSKNSIGIDYYATGTNPSQLQKQTELAAEAIMRTIDRLAGSGGGVFGAAVEEDSVTWDWLDGYTEGVAPLYIGVATGTIPVDDRESGL